LAGPRESGEAQEGATGEGRGREGNSQDKKVPVGLFDYFKYLLSESFKAMVARMSLEAMYP
jgi:hypothetical protein